MAAKSLNQVNLIGNMCSDIQIKKTNGVFFARFDLQLIGDTKAMTNMNRLFSVFYLE